MVSSILYNLEAPACEGTGRESCEQARQHHALQRFLVARYAHLRRRLVRHLGCADMADECLHDAWLRLGEMEIPAAVQNPEAYVYRVACNIAMDRIRHNRSWQFAGSEMEVGYFADEAPGPDQIAAARSELAALERVMASLPRRHRSVLVALRIDEMTRQDVADCHDLSLRSVDTVLRQSLNYCAENTGQALVTGARSARRALRYPAAANQHNK